MRIRERLHREDGATMVIMGVGLVLLMTVAALVVDLAAVRVNRAVSRTVTDNAAAAGSLELDNRDGRSACNAAIDYLELNLETSGPFAGVNCNPFPTKCDDSTPISVTTGTVDQWIARITYPVLDTHPTLDPDAIGATTQTVVAADGHPCDRISVQLESNHQSFFAGVIGSGALQTEVHTVALAAIPSEGSIPLNLLILERYDCGAVSASGGAGGDGGILVDGVYNPATGEVEPGYIAIDSDGSGANCSSNGTLDVDGTGSSIRADGPEGCPGQLGSHTLPGGIKIGHGCGEIRTFASGTPGCNWPACTSGGTVAPDPKALLERKTRQEVDWRYNCKASYPFPTGWEINGCPGTPAPHIDDLVADYGTAAIPPGFVTWSSLGHSCNTGAGQIVVTGNIVVDCNKLTVGDEIIFEGGDVIFDGSVTTNNGTKLVINGDSSRPYPHDGSDTEAVAFFRGGGTISSSGGDLILHRTMAYFAPGTTFKMQGTSSGSLIWSAPSTGVFEDLALWSESATEHKLSGGAGLDLEGVFFVPNATVAYTGDGSQRSVEAQFIVRKLSVGGGGQLVVRPSFDRAILFPEIVAQLIR
jgi:hypothetical protein